MRLSAGLLLAIVSVFTPLARAQSPMPEWARASWAVFAKAHALAVSSRIRPAQMQGDFDGDGASDVAIVVENTRNHKQGIVFLHHNNAGPFLVGAGKTLGNGGDDFEWMDSWTVKPHGAKSRNDTVLLMRESSASGLVYFAGGQYHWKQQGD